MTKIEREAKAVLDLEKKIKYLAAHHYRGKGATARARKFVTLALGTNCPYCGRVLTQKNLELDHKMPLVKSKVKKNLYSPRQLELLNSDENKGPICNVCNGAKGELTWYEFELFVTYVQKAVQRDMEMEKTPEYRLVAPGKFDLQYVLSKMKSAGFRYIPK